MSNFQGVSVWIKSSFILISVGLVVWLAAKSSSREDGIYLLSTICLIVGIICYYAASLLSFLFIFIDETKGNKIVLIIMLVCAFVAGVTGFIAAMVVRTSEFSGRLCYASVCAIIAGIFCVLELVGVGGGGGAK